MKPPHLPLTPRRLLTPIAAGGIVHPPNDMSSDEIDVYTTAGVAVPIAIFPQREG